MLLFMWLYMSLSDLYMLMVYSLDTASHKNRPASPILKLKWVVVPSPALQHYGRHFSSGKMTENIRVSIPYIDSVMLSDIDKENHSLAVDYSKPIVRYGWTTTCRGTEKAL